MSMCTIFRGGVATPSLLLSIVSISFQLPILRFCQLQPDSATSGLDRVLKSLPSLRAGVVAAAFRQLYQGLGIGRVNFLGKGFFKSAFWNWQCQPVRNMKCR